MAIVVKEYSLLLCVAPQRHAELLHIVNGGVEVFLVFGLMTRQLSVITLSWMEAHPPLVAIVPSVVATSSLFVPMPSEVLLKADLT